MSLHTLLTVCVRLNNRWMKLTVSSRHKMCNRKAGVLQASLKSEASLVSLYGITVGDSRHTALRGEEEIKRQCQDQPSFDENPPSQAATSYIHPLSLMHVNEFTALNLTAAHTLCLDCTDTHICKYVMTHRTTLFIYILKHSDCLIVALVLGCHFFFSVGMLKGKKIMVKLLQCVLTL